MKNKWQVIAGLALSLMVMMTAAAPVLAQEEKPAATADSLPGRGSLAIVAPWAVPVNKEFTARVLLRENQEAFQGAGVWAMSADTVETLKDELGILRDDSNQPDVNADYESLLEKRGTFLGRTGEDGRVKYAFKQAGAYILIAAKNGYRPGTAHIKIGENDKALVIKAPKRAPVGQEVTIGVFERPTQGAVEGAGVWAVTRDNMDTLQQEAQKLKGDASIAAEDKDYEALVKTHGVFLGRTDKDGQVSHTFKEAGIYLLVAVKKGYFPGFAPLAIVEKPNALGIKATPPQTQVGKEVTLNVFDKENNEPVGNAGIWAFSRDKAEALKQEMSALEKNSSNATADRDYEATIASRGSFLGRTDSDGKLGAKFDTAGAYVLVTAKKGYLPGFTTLAVKDLPKPKPTTSDNRTALRAVKPEARIQTTPIKPNSRSQITPVKPQIRTTPNLQTN